MIPRMLTPLIALLILFRTAVADDRPMPGSPADVGMSAATLQTGVQLFADAVEADELRGAVILVARDGRVVLHEALGWRNKEAQQPMQRDTLFRMASNTKPVVAAAALILSEENRLMLDEEIGKRLPAFNHVSYAGVTPHTLLTHTSGLRLPGLFLEPLMQKSAAHPDAPSLQLEVDRFGMFAPFEPPGETFEYNNAGYNILGALIEVQSGLPLETFLTERIYEPLGMRDTAHRLIAERTDRMAVVYERDPKSKDWKVRFRQDSPMKVPFVRASGGMISTAADYAAFCQMLLDGGSYGGQELLSRESVDLAVWPHSRSVYTSGQAEQQEQFYGYGWYVDKNGVFSHGGSDGTFAWVDPRRRIVGVILAPSPGGTIPRKEFIELVNAACGD